MSLVVCFYCNFNGGGTERATANLVQHLKNHHKVLMLSTSQLEASYPVEGVRLDHVDSHSLIKQTRSLRRYLRENDVDVLVALEALSGITAIPATFVTHCKLVIWEHANYYQDQGSKYTQTIRWLEMLLADAYVVLTKRDLGNFRNHFRHIGTRLVQIYNVLEPVDGVAYDTNSTTIISAGHINKIKNFSIIPEVAARALKGHPDWSWKIYGDVADEDEHRKIQEGIARYGLEGRVVLCGRCDDMDAEYRKAAIYVMTSLQEGFPMVLLEAKAHGLPIVSFNIETGPDEIVRDGVDGYLVKPYDCERMVQKIKSLIEYESRRIEFSQKSSTDLGMYTQDRIVQQWTTVLESL